MPQALHGLCYTEIKMQELASTTATSMLGCPLAPSVLDSSTSSAPLLAASIHLLRSVDSSCAYRGAIKHRGVESRCAPSSRYLYIRGLYGRGPGEFQDDPHGQGQIVSIS